MPDSLRALRRLGVELDPLDAAALRGIRFIEGPFSIEAQFPLDFGLTVRRTSLHRQLVAQAQAMGVDMRWGAQRIEIQNEAVTLQGEPVRAEFIVGADGQRSQVRRAAGLAQTWHESTRFGFRQHFRIRPWSDHVEVYWSSGVQAYVTPVRHNEVGVAVVSKNSKLRVADAITIFPDLAARLGSASACSTERGSPTVWRRLRRVYRGNTVLTGDASGSVDCITGDGLCLAFKEALALGESLRSGNLQKYQRAHDRLNRRARVMTALLLTLSRKDRLRKTVFTLLQREPELFAAFLGIHVGQPFKTEFEMRRLIRMGVGLFQPEYR
jgi:2-polyprenyl-6-methoxyphenol hydroxylase-like FAD-dependent oxidoreductase